MSEKREKELKRGYVGAPISSPYSGKNKTFSKMQSQTTKNYSKILNLTENNAGGNSGNNKIVNRREDFMESLKKSRERSHSRKGEDGFFDKLRNKYNIPHREKQEEEEEEEGRRDTRSVNMPSSGIRYIPFNNEAPAAVNIQKIRDIVNRTGGKNFISRRESASSQEEPTQPPPRSKDPEGFNKWNTNFRSYQNTKRLSERERDHPRDYEEEERSYENARAEQQMDTERISKRQKLADGMKPKSMSNNSLIYYPENTPVSNEVLKGKKYARNPMPSMNQTTKEMNRSTVSYDLPYFKGDGSSSNSRVSYNTAKLNNNNSTYY